VILLVGAGLLARSFVRLLDVDAGYRADHVLVARLQLPRSATSERTNALTDHVLARVRGTPGVVAAGAGNMMPLTPMTEITTFPLPQVAGGIPVLARATTYVVTPGYAEALGLRVREGRLFSEADVAAGAQKMIVNQEFARLYLAGSPVGRRVNGFSLIGVVGNVLKDGNDREPQPEIYFVNGSAGQRIEAAVNIVVRTAGQPAALTAGLRDMIREADSSAAIEEIAPLSSMLARAVDQPRFSMMVLAAFAMLALMLASAGLYGVTAHTVAQRQREFGIRAAIGASRFDLVQLVLGEGLGLTVAGVGIGLLCCTWLTPFMRATLFGVSPLDGTVFVAAPLVLIAVATLACVYPAIRAASTDPAVALRVD
jgi:putative ABC transport system permease protein